MSENKLINLGAKNGDCIAELVPGHATISLLVVEELGDHGYIEKRVCTKIIIPVPQGSPFWAMVLQLAQMQGLNAPRATVKATDEGELIDIIERHFDLLTCYNCGKPLNQPSSLSKHEVVATMLSDPGESNYPHSPDESGGLYFECNACAEERRLSNKAVDFKAPDKNLPKV